MERWSGRVAVVTGASVGIGAEICISLANAGLQVVGAARRHQLVEDLQKRVTGSGKIIARKCDTGDPKDIEELFQWVESNSGPVSVLVNNAAVLYTGTVHEIDGKEISVDNLTNLLNINIRGYTLCSRAAVRSMRKAKHEGHVININSVAGHFVPMVAGSDVPIFNCYPATKFAVTALTEITRQELACSDTKIRVTSISPGAVKTAMIKQITNFPEGPTMLEPEDVADAVLFALGAPYRCNVHELSLRPTGEKIN